METDTSAMDAFLASSGQAQAAASKHAQPRARARAKTKPDDSAMDAFLGTAEEPLPSFDPNAKAVTVAPPGRWDMTQNRYIPDNPIAASFTDYPGQRYTAEDLKNVQPDKLAQGRAALAGGALQSATLYFADELGAAVGAMMGQGSYRELRDENRAAERQAKEWDPRAHAVGQLIGAASTALVPGLGPTAAKPLLSWANTGRAALAGGAQALGTSEADLTKGEVGKAALDTAEGAGAGVAANTVLGAAGKGLGAAGRWIAGAPERVATKDNNAFLSSAVGGADKSVRDKIAANKDITLEVAKKHDLVGAVKDPQELVKRTNAAIADIGEQTGKIYEATGAPIPIANITGELAKMRDEMASSVATKDQAKNVQKVIDDIWSTHGNLEKLPPGERGITPMGTEGMWRAPKGKVNYTMTPQEVRKEITAIQDKGYAGSYSDPSVVRDLQRSTAARMRDVLANHVEAHSGPEVAAQLAELNKTTSTLYGLKEAAEDRVLSTSIPKSTMGVHVKSILDYVGNAGVGGGLTAAALGHYGYGASAIAAGLAAKFGPAIGAKAERTISTMVYAVQHGAKPEHLQAIAKASGFVGDPARQLIDAALTKTAASAAVGSTQ